MKPVSKPIDVLNRKLVSAFRGRKPARVKFTDYADGVRTDCFVVKVGRDIAAFEIIGDGGYLEGFNCVPLEGIVSFDYPAPNALFKQRLLQLRKQSPAKSFPYDVSSWRALIKSAESHFPLTTIHIGDACYIGKVLSVDAHTVSLHEITPSAEWDDEVTYYRFDEVTRVDFGGPYEDGLSLVGGRPPELQVRSDVANASKRGAHTSNASVSTARPRRQR
jgi:hypothetical protein